MTQQNDDTKTIYRAVCLICIALSVFSGRLLAGSEKKVRIAIVAGKASGLNVAPLVSLLEAKLSEAGGIELLEREHIDSILDEHKLSLTGLVQRDNIIKAGKLLRADAFLLLSLEKTPEGGGDSNALLRIRIVETSYGIRLIDTFEPADDKEALQTAERIAGKVGFAVAKLAVPPEDSIAVGILDVHRVGIDESYRSLVKSLPTLLSIRLSKEPRIIILEREDLKILRDEKMLTAGLDTKFWNSAVLIEGHLQLKGKKDLELKVSLKGASAKDTATFAVTFDPNETVAAIGKIATSIIQELLNTPPTSSWQPKQEAGEFFKHGQLLLNHGRYQQAMPLLETAYALGIDNVNSTNALFESEWAAREVVSSRDHSMPVPVFYSNLELANLVSRLVRQMQAKYNDGSLSGSDVCKKWGRDGGRWGFLGDYFCSFASVSTPKIKEINRENRRVWAAIRVQFVKRTRWQTRIFFRLAWASSDDHKEVIKNLRKTFSELILSPEMGGRYGSVDSRFTNYSEYNDFEYMKHRTKNLFKFGHLSGQEKDLTALWIQYLHELTEVKDPLVNFMGCIALSKTLTEMDDPQAKVYCKQARKIVPTILETYKDSLGERTKNLIYSKMIFVYARNTGFKQGEVLVILKEIFDPMIESKDVDKLVEWKTVLWLGCSFWATTTEEARRYIQLMERIEDVLELDMNNAHARTILNMIKSRQMKMRRTFPELKLVQKQPSLPVTMLLSKEDSLLKSWITELYVTVQGDILWVGFKENNRNGDGLFLAGINLAKKEPVALWRSHTVHKRIPNPGLRCMAIGEDATYAAILDVGLVEFPGSLTKGRGFLKEPKILTQANGLPSLHFTGMAWEKNKLWIAYGGEGKECGLGLYDPKTEVWETVFCSTLKGAPLFNDGLQYHLLDITFAPPNDLYFCTRLASYGVPALGWSRPRGDLRKLNTDTRQLERIRPAVKRQMEKSYSDDFNGYLSSAAAVHDNKLWTLAGQVRLMIVPRGKQFDEAEIIDNNILDGGKVRRFFSTEYGLIAIGEEGTVGLIESTGEKKQSLQKVNK